MQPLPDHAFSAPLRARDAAALGLSRREREGPLWRSPTHGVLAWHGVDADDPRQRILTAAATFAPRTVLGGWAAAFVHGATELDGRGSWGGQRLPVTACCPPEARVRRAGIVVKRSVLLADDTELVAGVPVTTLVRTAFDLARSSPLVEGVVALDALARDCRLDLAAVSAYATARPHWRGVRHVHRAVDLADPRTRSTWESRLRVLWIVDAGLPRPLVNARVLDERGRLLGEVDLLDPASGLVGEFDGSHHRDPVQHSNDNSREEGLERAGLVVTRFGARDLGIDRRRTVHRLRAAHAQARQGAGRPRWSIQAA